MTDTTQTVVVTAPFQVVHDGEVHGPGDAVTVPTGVAELWLSNGWVTSKPTDRAATTVKSSRK